MTPSHPLALLALASGASLSAFAQSGAPAGSEAELRLHSPERSGVHTLAQTRTEIVITSRRREESAHDVPVPVSVISGSLAEDTGGFNVSRLKELVPSVQLYSTNPRNTTLSIRGLGSTFGLTNDGLDQGVGFYVDGVYLARPAVTTLDFIDVERIEVLRGPQGTLFGKNTTSGAFNVSTRKPEFEPGALVEVSAGNYEHRQIRGFATGPLSQTVAGRLSVSGTQRAGTLINVVDGRDINTLDNIGVRGQLLWQPTEQTDVRLIAELSHQDPAGYAQVFAGVVPTLRAEHRQFNNIIADLGYEPASRNPFDRVIDHNSDWRSGNDFGGVSLNIDTDVAGGTLTSTTAWHFWDWRPGNDRDWLGLNVVTLSQAPSDHEQISQEIRWAGDLHEHVSAVFGAYAIRQALKPSPAHQEEAGPDQWRFLQPAPGATQWLAPGLLDGVGSNNYPVLDTFSAALFGQLEWFLHDQWRLLTGLRYNYDDKQVDFRREPYFLGDESGFSPEELAARRSIYGAQEFTASIDDTNLTGLVTLVYTPTDWVNVYGSYSSSFKPIGLNLGGLPGGANPDLSVAVIQPEYVQHYEIGVKTQPFPGANLDVVLHRSDIEDYQAQVQDPDPSLNRGYLANAEGVRVQGLEIDGSLSLASIRLSASYAYTDGKYTSFANAPVPLELTGLPGGRVDVSGGRLPGLSRHAASVGGEYTRPLTLFHTWGEFFIGLDSFYRSGFSSSPSPSRYLNVDGYALLNARVGFRTDDAWTAFLWARNLLDKDYFEQLLPGSGGAGYYVAMLGDPRTYGATLRYQW